MAEVKKDNTELIRTSALVAFGILILAGIIYFAWNRTDKSANDTTETVQNTDNSNDSNANAAEVDKLSARETKLTPENYEAFTKQSGVVLVDVYSPTCPHCQVIAPILSALADEYGDKLHVGKMSVTIDANRDFILAREKDFQYVPAIWIYKDGVVKESFTGERTKDQFKALIDKYL